MSVGSGPRGSSPDPAGPSDRLLRGCPSNDAVDVDVEAIGPMGDVADGARCILGGEKLINTARAVD